MPKTSRKFKPIDLRAPGAIEQLLAFHHSLVGDARMQEGGGSDGGDGGGDAGATDAGADQGGQQTDQDADKAGEGKVEDLPEWAQALLKKAQKEAGDASAKARTTAKQQAADEARQQLVQDLGKALGLVKDDKDKIDPDELTKQVTAAQQAQRQSAVELAVYKTASKHSGDPDALLDSRAFLAKVADLDPTASDFASKVDEAIKSAVADNPKLKAARAAGQSTVQHPGGSGEGRTPGKPKSIDAAVSARYGTA